MKKILILILHQKRGIAKLIEDSFDGNLRSTLEEMMKKMVGAYSIAVIDTENPDTIVGIKLGSPMIV